MAGNSTAACITAENITAGYIAAGCITAGYMMAMQGYLSAFWKL